MRSINPATNELIAQYPELDEAGVRAAIGAAEAASTFWRSAPFAMRRAVLEHIAKQLRSEAAALAATITAEMGKPITQAESEVEKCAIGVEYFAKNGETHLSPRKLTSDAAHSFVRYDPLGVVLGVMPWNFPFWQAFRFAAPALMAGNVCLLKHASNVSGCALAIERIIREAALAQDAPAAIFTTLLLPSSRLEEVVREAAVKGVALTGSEQAGMSIARLAGAHLKKCVLELGGSDPFLVLDDAPLKVVVTKAVEARLVNSGQSCIAAKRFIVHRRVAEEFEREFADALASVAPSDPRERTCQLGPLARPDLVEELHRHVSRSLEQGARLVIGGKRSELGAAYYPPTLLADVRPGMAAFDEETFGPVAALTIAENEHEMIQLANRSRFGLGASVWTGDPVKAEALAAKIEAGMVFINGIVKSDPRLPFGGIKHSGYGRELAAEGIHEFTNVKTVWRGVALS